MRTDLQARRISAVIKSEESRGITAKTLQPHILPWRPGRDLYKSRNRHAMVCQITDGRLDVNVESVSATGKWGLQMNTRRRLVLGLMAGALTVPHASFAQ
jgi:hypothetical protein